MAPNAAGGGLETPGARPEGRGSGQRSILQLVVGGFVGTVALVLIMFYLEPVFISRSSNLFRALGVELSTPHGLGLVVFHIFNGSIIFPIGFAFFAARWRIPWIAKGLVWGLVLWLLSGIVVMPMSGFGFFGYDADGPRVAVTSLLAHLAYGGLQGVIAAIPARKMD